MPTFALTVGSLGDFIALSDLIVKIGVVLYRPGECSKDYQDLLRELEHFAQILSKIAICKGQKMTLVAEGCLKAVQIEADRTTQVIKEFLDKRQQNSSGIWNKIMWAKNGPSEMAELRRTLSAHREMLSFLLEIMLSQQLSDVMMTCEANIKDIQTIAKHCPEQLTLIDAIGNYRKISFDFCISYELFTDVLRAYYKHHELPGHAFVTRGDYQIVFGDEHKIVEATEWSIMIHPDSKVAMSMILRRRGDTAVKCPRCGAAPENEGVGGWANCSLCPGRFRTTVREDNAEEIVSPAVNVDHDVDPSQGSVPERRTTTSRQDTSEVVWKRFRLLSIISLVRRISNPTAKVDEGPKKRCRNCGALGRHENGKCVEKWGPGPQGPETRCEECSRRPDPPPKEDAKDTGKNIKDSDLRKFIGKKFNTLFNKGSASSTSPSVENNPDPTPTSVLSSDSSFLRSPPLFSPFTFNPRFIPPGTQMGTSPVESSGIASSSSHQYPNISSFTTTASNPVYLRYPYGSIESINRPRHSLDGPIGEINSGGSGESIQWKCDICGLSFEYQDIYLAHMNSHNNVDPYVCNGDCGDEHCRFSFRSSKDLQTHKTTGSYPCRLCPARFARKRDLTRHVCSVHSASLGFPRK